MSARWDTVSGTYALLLVDDQSPQEGETRPGLLARAALDYIGRHKVA